MRAESTDSAMPVVWNIRWNGGSSRVWNRAASAGANLGGIRRTQRVLHHLLDQFALGVVIVDRDLRIAYHNRFAQRVAGFKHGLVFERGLLAVRDPALVRQACLEFPGRVEGSAGQTSKTVGTMPRNLLGRGFSAAYLGC